MSKDLAKAIQKRVVIDVVFSLSSRTTSSMTSVSLERTQMFNDTLQKQLSEKQKALNLKIHEETPEWIHDRKKEIADIQRDMFAQKQEDVKQEEILTLSDHAWIRYLERVKGKDRNKVISNLIPKEILSAITLAKDITLEIDGVRIVILNNNIVTIYNKDTDV